MGGMVYIGMAFLRLQFNNFGKLLELYVTTGNVLTRFLNLG